MQTEVSHLHPVKAVAAGFKRYYGKICPKHPEIKGERNARSRACIACSRNSMRLRRAADPDYYRRVTRIAYNKWYPKNREVLLSKVRQRRTGMSPELFMRLMEFQEGKCALCLKPFGDKRHADHCHGTAAPRGILCGHCNRVEGIIRRSGVEPAEFGRRLAAYLKDPPVKKLERN